MKKIRSFLINASVLLGVVVLTAVAFEVAGRALFGGPIALWLTPGERDVQTDFDVTYSVSPEGTRTVCQPDPSADDPEDIYFVGDSFTFGMGIQDLKDFVGRLSCRFPEYSFHNYGSIGRNLNYYRMAIEQRLSETSRALFIVLFENDVVLDRNLFIRDLKDWLYRNSFIGALLHHARVEIHRRQRPYQGDRSPEAKPEDRYNSPKAVFSADPSSLRPVVSLTEAEKLAFGARLERLLAAALEKNPDLDVYMTLIPEAATLSEPHQRFYRSAGAALLPTVGTPSPAYREASEVCHRHDACRFIDIFDEMLAAGADFYFPSDFHLNEKGHRYLADKISKVLAQFQDRD